MTLVPGTWEAEVGTKAQRETPSQGFKKSFGAICDKEFHFYKEISDSLCFFTYILRDTVSTADSRVVSSLLSGNLS